MKGLKGLLCWDWKWSYNIRFSFKYLLFLFIVRTIMSLDTVGKLCREFKILRQTSNLNINYNLGKCLKPSFDLVKVCLNYESNVDIVMERIMSESHVLRYYKLQNYKWFLEPGYALWVVRRTKYINFENVEFFLMRQRDPLVRCKSLGKFC